MTVGQTRVLLLVCYFIETILVFTDDVIQCVRQHSFIGCVFMQNRRKCMAYSCASNLTNFDNVMVYNVYNFVPVQTSIAVFVRQLYCVHHTQTNLCQNMQF